MKPQILNEMKISKLSYLSVIFFSSELSQGGFTTVFGTDDADFTGRSGLGRQQIRPRVLHKLLHGNGIRQNIHLIQEAENTSTNQYKPAQTSTNRYKPVQTGTNQYSRISL